MTGARQSIGGTNVSCCDFESLSCYADGELEPEAAARVGEHLSRCTRCATLATRLRERFEADDARRAGGGVGSGCCVEEQLILYAAGGLRGAERAALAAHLADCDACVAAVTTLHRHLAVEPAVAAVLPAELGRRALHAFAGAPVAAGAPLPAPASWRLRWSTRLERMRSLLRVPVLVPAALAAGALLAVIWQPGALEHSVAGERSRAVALPSATRRVTAVDAAVYSRPSAQSELVGTLHRGAVVAVTGEERDWYAVHLDGGPSGWVAREAVE